MPRIQRFPLLFAACLIAAIAPLAQVPKDFRPVVPVLESRNSDSKLDEGRVREALWYAASDLHISPTKVPRIIVIHAAFQAGQIAHIPTIGWSADHQSYGATVRERTEDGSPLYYVWVVGKASDEILVRGVVQVLQLDTGMPVEVTAVMHRVLVHMHAVVRSADLQAG